MDKIQNQDYVIYRRMIIEWLTRVNLDYSLRPETFYLCINVVDRVLTNIKIQCRKEAFLLAVTAIFTSSKYEEIYPPELADFIALSPEEIEEKDVFNFEIKILKMLEYEMLTVSPYIFLVRDHLVIDPQNKKLFYLAQFLLEMSLLNKNFCRIPNSLKAASCLYSAFSILKLKEKEKNFWDNDFKYFTGYGSKELKFIYDLIINYIIAEKHFCDLNVYEKFQSSNFMGVSEIVSNFIKKN